MDFPSELLLVIQKPVRGGAIMDGDGNGTFVYVLTYKNISHYSEFKSAWVQYQLVASDKKLNRIGATRLYLNNISLAPCP